MTLLRCVCLCLLIDSVDHQGISCAVHLGMSSVNQWLHPVVCLLDLHQASIALAMQVPERKTDAPMRVPISGIYKIKGVGDVLAGRVEQGLVKPGDEVVFLPTHTTANPCIGKVFTVEMHHKRVDKAGPGDNVGMNIKNLDKGNMPRTGE